MPQPKAYKRDVSFAEMKGSPADFGGKLDQELDTLGKGFDQVLKNLSMLQEDDGRLKSGVVDGDALAPETAAGVKPAAEWQEKFKYTVNDTVYRGFSVFRCRKAHKSEIFEKDLDALFWEPIVSLDKIVAEIVAVKEDASFRRVADNMGQIGVLAALAAKLETVAVNLELLTGIADKMPKIVKVFELAQAIEGIETDMEAILKVAASVGDISMVAASSERINAAAKMADGFISVSENLPSILKVSGQIGQIVEIAENLDAVLEAPVHATRAEQAAARAERKEKFSD